MECVKERSDLSELTHSAESCACRGRLVTDREDLSGAQGAPGGASVQRGDLLPSAGAVEPCSFAVFIACDQLDLCFRDAGCSGSPDRDAHSQHRSPSRGVRDLELSSQRFGDRSQQREPDPQMEGAVGLLYALLSRHGLFPRIPVRGGVAHPDSERIVQISVEIDELAPSTLKATADMITGGQTGGLMDLLEDPPSEVEAPDALWRRVDRKETVHNVLDYQPVDYLTLDRMIARIWEVSAGPMLDRLLESDSRPERLSLLERLERIGPDIGPAIMERLDEGPWYRLRNLLNLLTRLPELPDGFSPWDYLDHDDPRVRREAYAIALSRDEFRKKALLRALDDSDSLVIEQALEIIQNRCPKDLIPHLVAMIQDPDCTPRIRVTCIRCLGSSRSPEALNALCDLVWYKKWLIVNTLAPKSATMLTALDVLAKSWSRDPQAIPIVRKARQSSDPQIQAIVRKTGAAR